MTPRFPFVAVTVAADQADELVAQLFELGASGVEQRDEQTHPEPDRGLALGAPPEGEDARWRPLAIRWRDDDAPGGPLPPRAQQPASPWPGPGQPAEPPVSGAVTLVASFASRAQAEQAARELCATAPSLRPELGEVVGDEWRERYKKAFAPFLLTPTLRIVPPWLPAPAPSVAGERLLWLDPGRAFGTGLHPTTALVAQLLHERAAELRGAELLDVGTGSGILALGALLLGARRAVGIDDDVDALEVARSNAEHNQLSDRFDVWATPLHELKGSFAWVVANIELRVLQTLATDLAAHVAPHGLLVLSGLLAPQHETLLAHLRATVARPFARLATAERSTGDDRWVAMVLRADAAEGSR